MDSNVYGSFALSCLSVAHPSPTLQQEHQHDDPALSQGPLPRRALALPEVGGRPRGNGLELFAQQPRLPQERQRVHAHQDHHPELLPQQREPRRQAAASHRHLVQQVIHRRGDKQEVRDHHGEDEQQEEAVVGAADAAVEEEAVVVVVLDADIAQLAVFGEVWENELGGGGEEKTLTWTHWR